MKASLYLVGMALMLLVALEPSSAQDVAFIGVNVVPMDRHTLLNDQTVVVRDGRISGVGPAGSTRVPEGALRLEGRGKYLMPGLGEMHGHIPSPLESREFTEAVLFLYVANGVTTVRGMQGSPGQLDLRERAKRGELMAPNLYLAGPPFSGKTIKSAEEAIQTVRQQKGEGWDLLKVLTGLARDHYDAMARTAKEVGISFAGHVPADVGLLHAIRSGQETFDHLDGYIEYLQGEKGPCPTPGFKRSPSCRAKRAFGSCRPWLCGKRSEEPQIWLPCVLIRS